jgi:anti-sigma regulatory factor (Ser/Thr protein kinase)
VDQISHSVQDFQTLEPVRDYLLYDLPDFLVVDLESPQTDLGAIRRILNEDPWLGGIGIICLVARAKSADFLQLATEWNLLAVVEREDLDGLQKVLGTILRTPVLILDYQKTNPFHESPKGSIKIKNDLSEAEEIAGMVSSYLLRTGRIEKKKSYNLNMSLSELLINAIEHGNCMISFSDKTKLLEADVNVAEHIAKLNKDPEIGSRTVTLEYSIQKDSSTWIVRDMGEGFDHKKYLNSENQDLFLPHGRGILMAANSSDSLSYNGKGNEATLVCNHQKEDEYRVPVGLLTEEVAIFQKGEVVFSENEESSHLYYILTGEFEVSVGGTRVGHLAPADMFMGEMSFLLNKRRTATVVSLNRSRLLKISHRSFIRIIKTHPNYMLVLARLLAQRLSRTNLATG